MARETSGLAQRLASSSLLEIKKKVGVYENDCSAENHIDPFSAYENIADFVRSPSCNKPVNHKDYGYSTFFLLSETKFPAISDQYSTGGRISSSVRTC